MISDCTDSLFVALFTLVVVVFSKGLNGNLGKLALLVLVALTSFTRFALVIWVLVSIIMARKLGLRYGVSVFAVASLAAMPTLLSGDSISKIPGSGNISSKGELLSFPITILKVVFFELSELFVLDRFMFLALILATIVLVRRIDSISSSLFLTVLIAVTLLGGINGVLGVNFRYQLPLIPFLYWAIVDYIYESFKTSHMLKK
jgi:hypothetical protein